MFKGDRSFFFGRKKSSQKKKIVPGSVTKVRGAKYTFPIEGNINDLKVNHEQLRETIDKIEKEVKPGSNKSSTTTKKFKGKKKNHSNSLRPLFNFSDREDDIKKRQMKNGKVKKKYGTISHRIENLEMNDSYNISQNRREKFIKLLNSSQVNLEELKKTSWSGIPFEFRGIVWKLISGYYPCKKKMREKMVEKKRKEYFTFCEKYCPEKSEDDYEDDDYTEKQKHQIKIDIPRTNPGIPFFKVKQIQDLICRILMVWAFRHPASGYVQGQNDILAIFLVVFYLDETGKSNIKAVTQEDVDQHLEKLRNIEADVFWCFSYFIDTIQDHYIRGMPGISRMVDSVREVIKKIDFKLYNHINKIGLQFEQLFFRWMNCLLIREFSIKHVTRIFDTYLSEKEFEVLHVYVCAAFLKNWSEHLCKLDSSEFFIFIQSLPTDNWGYKEVEMLLSQAYVLKSLYNIE